ncbi:protein CURVATURE THYLAKOID 1C, chloroplastic isoform X2 [Iris pallida]|uniref:Protein CURVATURE THYLAKOID 1C, chloroplastic isoform X2 n=1 Tax=Iris pallida TaxID=29817 RepID=A0AAX6IHN3_IRIPA|nr:protein CURVATURE THYLAKOID 1C, chloroplastic isoform X2 [Iris pallida]
MTCIEPPHKKMEKKKDFCYIIWLVINCVTSSLLRTSSQRSMAFAASVIAPHSLFLLRNKTHFRSLQKIPSSSFSGRQNFVAIVAKAVGDSSDSSSESIVKYVKTAWTRSEDLIALAGLGFAVIAGLWASANLVAAIDKLPVLPGVLEFIGILFSWWFVYRYLLFKPDREELVKNIKTTFSDIIGQ